MPTIQFGSAIIFCNPNAGNLPTNPTPVRPFTIQDVKLEMKGKIEQLRGQNQFPDDTATGDKDGTFEWSMGQRDYNFLNNIFLADVTSAAGVSATDGGLTAVAIPTTPYHITPTPPDSGTWYEDLGVVFSSGVALTLVPSSPAAGQYSVSAGVYTFSSADNASGLSVIIAYRYTVTGIGSTTEVNNQVQGYGPQFQACLLDKYKPISGVYSTVFLYAAKISDVSMPYKRSGYQMVDCKGQYFGTSSGSRLSAVADFYSNSAGS